MRPLLLFYFSFIFIYFSCVSRAVLAGCLLCDSFPALRCSLQPGCRGCGAPSWAPHGWGLAPSPLAVPSRGLLPIKGVINVCYPHWLPWSVSDSPLQAASGQWSRPHTAVLIMRGAAGGHPSRGASSSQHCVSSRLLEGALPPQHNPW